MKRRELMCGLWQVAAALALWSAGATAQAVERLRKTRAEWKALLSAPAFAVLFDEATEPDEMQCIILEHRAEGHSANQRRASFDPIEKLTDSRRNNRFE